ncbi:hypothetical protein ACO0R3_000306 [Hanseniaspora guilliermondii]
MSTNSQSINEAKDDINSNTNNQSKKSPYSLFKVVKTNKDLARCPKTGYTMIDLSSKPTNLNDPHYHGLITEIQDHYEPLVKHIMGKGSFGEVIKGINLQTNRLVAIKKLKIMKTDDIFPIVAQREIMILKKMCHHNVITLNDVIFDNFEKFAIKPKEQATSSTKSSSRNPFMTEAEVNSMGNPTNIAPDRFFYMVLPYMVSDLAGIIHNPYFELTIPKIKNILMQMLSGLDYIHKMKYFHRDIKTANILIDQNGILKIADFGLSRLYYGCPPNKKLPGGSGAGMKFTALVVTRWYRAPEIVLCDRFYTTAIDIWGVGCIFGEFFIKKPILQGKTDIEQGHLIFQMFGKPDYQSWPTLKYLKQFDAHYSNKQYLGNYKGLFGSFLDEVGLDLFQKMMTLDPYQRITASAALEHEWFTMEPCPVEHLQFEKVMESHESDINNFDKLREEMLSKAANKSKINYNSSRHSENPQTSSVSRFRGGADKLASKRARSEEDLNKTLQLLDDVQPLNNDRYHRYNRNQMRNVTGSRFETYSRFQGNTETVTKSRFNNQRVETDRQNIASTYTKAESLPEAPTEESGDEVTSFIKVYKKKKSEMAAFQNDTLENKKQDNKQADKKTKKRGNGSIKISIEDMYE